MLRLTCTSLVLALEEVPPLDLKGPALLRRGRFIQGEFFPADLPEDALAEAALELIRYGQEARALGEKVASLEAVPLRINGEDG